MQTAVARSRRARCAGTILPRAPGNCAGNSATEFLTGVRVEGDRLLNVRDESAWKIGAHLAKTRHPRDSGGQQGGVARITGAQFGRVGEATVGDDAEAVEIRARWRLGPPHHLGGNVPGVPCVAAASVEPTPAAREASPKSASFATQSERRTRMFEGDTSP